MQGRCIQVFGLGNLRETDHWEDFGVEGNTIKKNECSRCVMKGGAYSVLGWKT